MGWNVEFSRCSYWYEHADIALVTLAAVCAHNPCGFLVGRDIFAKAWRLAKQRTANMDTLIALGVGSAYGYSLPALFRRRGHLYFEAGAAIITFVLLGRFLEERAKGKAGEAIRKLVDLQPQTATLIRDGQEIVIAVDDCVIDDVLLVRPGEKIPTDGIVIQAYLRLMKPW